MKTFSFLFVLFVLTVSCKKDVTTTPVIDNTVDTSCATANSIPPFSAFQLRYTLNIPSTTPSTWSNFTSCGGAAYTGDVSSLSSTSRWAYTFIEGGQPHPFASSRVPDNAQLTVTTADNIITFEMKGFFNKTGAFVPTDYKADNACDKWGDIALFDYVLKVDPTTKSVVSAMLTLNGKGYKSSYDVTKAIIARFTTPPNYLGSDNEWEFQAGQPTMLNTTKTHTLMLDVLVVNIHRVQ